MPISFNSFNTPIWTVDVDPLVSEIVDDKTIFKMTNRGSNGLDALQSSASTPVTLEQNAFGHYYGANVSSYAINYDFYFNSLSAFNHIHDGSSNATFFVVINPDLAAFSSVLGNCLGAQLSQIGFTLVLDNSPAEIKFYINNGLGIDHSAVLRVGMSSSPGLLVIAIKKTPTNCTLFVNGTSYDTSTIIGASSSDASYNLYMYGGPATVGCTRGKCGMIKISDIALNDDFIVQYSNQLYDHYS